MSAELAPWRSPLARALHRHRRQPQARYLQLATVTADGYPANRTVVFRGFRRATNQVAIATDTRSEKVAHLAARPWGELCWYFPESREQFRLFGSFLAVGPGTAAPELQEERQRIWANLSEAARSQFAWPPPGQPHAGCPEAFAGPPPPADPPLATFCLLLLAPQRVDWLELRGEPQHRWRYLLTEGDRWQQLALNP